MEQQEQQLMKLEGTVEHVIYENADSGYAVFEVDAGGTDVVVAGNVGGVDNGMSVTVYGHMVPPQLRRAVPRRDHRSAPARGPHRYFKLPVQRRAALYRAVHRQKNRGKIRR